MEEYITESGMTFGPFLAEELIHIEKCDQYQNIKTGMHISEFLYTDQDKKRLIFIEAKTSAPNPNSVLVENPRETFLKYINEIREKFENSLDLYVNLALKRDVPAGFFEIDYKSLEIVFILVIKNHEKAWLKDVKDALEMAVRSIHRTNKIWRCKVLVMNEELARRKRLVVSDSIGVSGL